jgi:hypothetical protein
VGEAWFARTVFLADGIFVLGEQNCELPRSSKIWNIIAKEHLFCSGTNGLLGRYDRNEKLSQGDLIEPSLSGATSLDSNGKYEA